MKDKLIDNIKEVSSEIVSNEDGGGVGEIDKLMNQASPNKSGGFLAFVGEMFKVTLIALAIILPVRYFLIKPFYVNGASMVPTYIDGEYLIVDEISYRFNLPVRGDVIVFKYPEDPKQFFIKRVIGLPGDRVVIKDGEVILYAGAAEEKLVLDEEYLTPNTHTAGNVDSTLGEDEYFVLGDNRNASLDSRRFGTLSKQEIVGKTWLRGWPLDRIGIVDHYNFDK
jgi:signal peptidase I